VLHYFDLSAGTLDLVDTKVLQDPVVFFEDQAQKEQS
jgi:hypothetical protein